MSTRNPDTPFTPEQALRHRNMVARMEELSFSQADVRKLTMGIDVGQMSKMWNAIEPIGDEMAGRLEKALRMESGGLSTDNAVELG